MILSELTNNSTVEELALARTPSSSAAHALYIKGRAAGTSWRPMAILRPGERRHSGPTDRPFQFCAHIRRLAEDIVQRTPDFRHIQMPRILLSALQARNGHPHGLQARVTPLRFAHGQLQRQRRGTTFSRCSGYFLGDHEYLYVMTFSLPRFLDQQFGEKFITLFHELYHIGPEFNGDLRRHQGRCQLHTHSQRQYDRHMAGLAPQYPISGRQS